MPDACKPDPADQVLMGASSDGRDREEKAKPPVKTVAACGPAAGDAGRGGL